MNQKIHLPISENYVMHWGFWEALRELLQNAIDTKKYNVSTMKSSGVIKIESSAGSLDLSTLMLGESTKRDDKSCIGKYGEGYKLALLVLCRLGHEVHIKNGYDCWRVSLEDHPQLKVRCLTIEVFEDTYIDENNKDSLSFVVCDLNDEHFSLLEEKYIGNHYLGDRDDIKLIAKNQGSYCVELSEGRKKVFVGGLFVCDLDDDYHYSYDFAPDVLELDRDRGTVSNFYLQREATRLLADSGETELLIEMANNKAKDVSDYYKIDKGQSYITSSTGYDKNTVAVAIKSFIKKHGKKAYPINQNSDHQSIKLTTEKCVSLGLTPIMVKPLLFDIIESKYRDKLNIKKINGKISEQLSYFCRMNRNKMTPLARKRLSEIIESIQFQGN